MCSTRIRDRPVVPFTLFIERTNWFNQNRRYRRNDRWEPKGRISPDLPRRMCQLRPSGFQRSIIILMDLIFNATPRFLHGGPLSLLSLFPFSQKKLMLAFNIINFVFPRAPTKSLWIFEEFLTFKNQKKIIISYIIEALHFSCDSLIPVPNQLSLLSFLIYNKRKKKVKIK